MADQKDSEKVVKPSISVKQYIDSYSYVFKKNGEDLIEISSTGDVFVKGKKLDESNPIVRASKEYFNV